MKKLVALNLELIVTIVDGGTGSDVIEITKEAGAPGGTILHGRGAGVHDAGRFLGIDIEPEKDIVLTIVPESLTNTVLNALSIEMKIFKPGNGIAFVIDLDKVIGISKIDEYSKVVELDDLMNGR
ncbi:P-II family nitrogen regulator [Enterococcus sp. BWT-B8]|uniref:P-II family nitrogen regulator n=1 Tax=Enterococcus sp. BWT-B8 TaxID=2885157 RepID=UPI001E40E5E6|nr:P-II family nitrogen regulator [Enterococcus sp. BWT-B8]MCB5952766.1 P-II family nitrogen regulator [Enterococcus sp. BWT-B8]